MASASTERTPLLPTTPATAPSVASKSQRSVTFHPQTTISHVTGFAETSSLQNPAPASASTAPAPVPAPATQPRLSSLNSKLRRRNSHGSALAAMPTPAAVSKIGPQRTTKTAQKLKILPNPETGEDGLDEESGRDVYAQFTRIKDPTARRDAARLGKADREKLPRVTAYCTANQYQFEGLMRFLKSKKARDRGANPKQFDECIYTPFNYTRATDDFAVNGIDESSLIPHHIERRFSDSAIEVGENTAQRRESLIDAYSPNGDSSLHPGPDSILQEHTLDAHLDHGHEVSSALTTLDFDTHVHVPEVFLFQYGTVVIWGMTVAQESNFLRDIAKFEGEKLSPDDVQVENFNFYYTREYQARIYNDFISLREKKNYMTKLAISHALSQSVKTSLFEELVSSTITATQSLPEQIALTGSIALNRREIHQQIGQLFILRINIHLQGSVLDSPELMWAEPSLEPVYSAVRSYLEMDQRVSLLTERLSVIGDLLAVLKDQVGTKHGEYLEWIVIILIAAEILVAAINIVVDLYAGVD